MGKWKKKKQVAKEKEEAEDRIAPDGALVSIDSLQKWLVAIAGIELVGITGSEHEEESGWIGGNSYETAAAPRAPQEDDQSYGNEHEHGSIAGTWNRLFHVDDRTGAFSSTKFTGVDHEEPQDKIPHTLSASVAFSGSDSLPATIGHLHGSSVTRSLGVQQPAKRKLADFEPTDDARPYKGKKLKTEVKLWKGPLTPAKGEDVSYGDSSEWSFPEDEDTECGQEEGRPHSSG